MFWTNCMPGFCRSKAKKIWTDSAKDSREKARAMARCATTFSFGLRRIRIAPSRGRTRIAVNRDIMESFEDASQMDIAQPPEHQQAEAKDAEKDVVLDQAGLGPAETRSDPVGRDP